MTNRIYEAMKKADAIAKERDDEFLGMMQQLDGRKKGTLKKKKTKKRKLR